MWLYPDVASHTVNQFDGRNLLWRSVIRYGTRKIWYWPLLMTLSSGPFADFPRRAPGANRPAAAWTSNFLCSGKRCTEPKRSPQCIRVD